MTTRVLSIEEKPLLPCATFAADRWNVFSRPKIVENTLAHHLSRLLRPYRQKHARQATSAPVRLPIVIRIA